MKLMKRFWNPFVKYPKLKPFGDADKDGKKNWVDCQPLNKNKKDEVLHMQDSLVKSTPQRKVDFYKNPPEELGPEPDSGIYREIKWREMED